MNDLISKSTLIDALKVHFDSCFREDGELLYSDHICTNDDVVDLIKLVENQPTVYNVDKVMEELKIIKEDALAEYNMGEYNLDNNIGNSIAENYRKDMNEGKCFAYDEAIEIVKQGGDADYVCKWRIVDRPHNLPIYNTSCGKIRMQYTTGVDIYCNGCGKKIKVVE